MSVDYSGIQLCTYGSVSISLTTYTARTYAQVREGIGRIGTLVRFEGEGEVTGSSPADLTSQLANIIQQCEVDGRDLIVTGINSASELSILASQCIDGGPHIEFDIQDGEVPLQKIVKLRCWSALVSATTPQNIYKSTLIVKPDGLRVISWNGEVLGPNAPAYFIKTVYPSFQQLYAAPGWKVDVRYEYGGEQFANPKVTYTLTATQFFGALPAIDQNNYAVDGDASVRVDRDEQMRKTTVYDFNLLVIGDTSKLLAQIRQQIVANLPALGVIQRESYQTDVLKENRIRASFTTLAGGDGSALMNWNESARIVSNTDVFTEKTYIGADPILVLAPSRFGRLTQSGSAIGAGAFKIPPPNEYPVFAEPPTVTYADLNETEKQTQWEFAMYLADAGGIAMAATDVDKLHPKDLGRDLQDTSAGAFWQPPNPNQTGPTP